MFSVGLPVPIGNQKIGHSIQQAGDDDAQTQAISQAAF